jgi:hypothetical protein
LTPKFVRLSNLPFSAKSSVKLCTAKYQTSDPTSFGHTTARERWPTILVSLPAIGISALLTFFQTGAIDDVYRSVSELDSSEQEKAEEGKAITQGLAKLKYELQHNRRLV